MNYDIRSILTTCQNILVPLPVLIKLNIRGTIEVLSLFKTPFRNSLPLLKPPLFLFVGIDQLLVVP